jgi:hypothetical protein
MKTTYNPVAKHARTYNKSTVQVDRKKAARKGYLKHKKPGASGLFSFPIRLSSRPCVADHRPNLHTLI